MKQFQKLVLSTLIFSLTACSTPEPKNEIVLIKAEDTTLLTNTALISPYSFEEELKTVYDTAPIKTILKEADASRTGYDWLVSKVSEGSPASVTSVIRSTFDTKGNLLATEQVPGSDVLTPAKPTIYQYGAKVAKGSYFLSSVITRYGYDCNGCGIGLDGAAGTSSGVRVRNLEVRQADGSWKEGITYEGYYVVAADPAFPICTVLEITNHSFNGMGLTAGVPFKAIVLDRGGAIKTRHLDLYIGSESNTNVVKSSRTSNIKIIVDGFLKWTRNSQGQQVCR